MSSNREVILITVCYCKRPAEMWAKKKREGIRNYYQQTALRQTYLLMVFLEEVKFFFQAVQISPQGGDDLLVVRLGLFQSNTVSLHRLTHHQLSLPSK